MTLPKIFLNRRRTGFCALTVLAVLAGVFLTVQPTNAQSILGFSPVKVIMTIIGVALEWLVYGVVSLLLLVVGLLISIAQYTGFGEARAVNVGWAIVRDLTNMFFVLVMLVIAFGTILGVEEFSYRQMLRRLLIMAVLINFSKVIAGVFIDFSQVIMLTFVNGFAAVAGANIVSMLQMNRISSLSPADIQVSQTQPNALADLVAGYFLALVMMGLALAVMLIMMIILVFRIVMLWLLVVMSPLAFFLSAFPRGRAAEAYGQWWKEFGNYLTIGPFLAFFLWLSFAVAGSGNIGSQGFPSQERPAGAETTRVNTFVTQAAEPENAISYVVGIALLMGGMMLSQQFSVLGGSMIGGAANWVKNTGAKIAKSPLKAGAFLAKDIDSRIAARTGISLNVPAYFRGAAKGLEARQAARYGAGKAKIQRAAEAGGVLGKLAQYAGDPEKAFKNYGIGGLGAIAATPLTAPLSLVSKRFGFMNKKYYSDEAEREKAKKSAADGEIGRIQGDRSTKVKSLKGDIMSDVAEIRAKALTAATPKERIQLNNDANRLQELTEMADKGKPLTRENLKEMFALSAKSSSDKFGGAKGDFDALEAQEIDQAKVAGKAAKKADFFTAKAQRAGPKGLPEEFAKHALDGGDLKAFADQARLEGDGAGLARVARKAATDDLDGFLEAEGFEASNQGLQKYLEKQKKLLKMSDQEMLSLANEISSVAKSKDPKYAGMTKMAAGGIMRWSNDEERGMAQAKAKSGGDLARKYREGAPIGHRDQDGKAQIDDSDIAAIVKSMGSLATLLGHPEKMNPKQLDILVEKQEELLNRVGSIVGKTNPEFVRLEAQLKSLSTKMAAIPPSMKEVLARAKATRPTP